VQLREVAQGAPGGREGPLQHSSRYVCQQQHPARRSELKPSEPWGTFWLHEYKQLMQ
jgi:hypothetical protein